MAQTTEGAMIKDPIAHIRDGLLAANDALYAMSNEEAKNRVADVVLMLLKSAVGFAAMGVCAFNYDAEKVKSMFNDCRDELDGQIRECLEFGGRFH